MSKVPMTEVSMEKCLLDMPYEMLFEVLRRLPKGKLIEISRMRSKFGDITGDARLWKDVYIKYKPYGKSYYRCPKETHQIFAFEELYSEPWPVKVLDLSNTKINPPVSSHIDRIVEVTRLNMTSIIADKVTLEAILAKYQCKELNLDLNMYGLQNHIMEIAPEAFQKQTNLEVLSISGYKGYIPSHKIQAARRRWVAEVLNNFRNLKTLNLEYNHFTCFEMMGVVDNLPTSLEKLSSACPWPDYGFYAALAGRTPNLKEISVRSSVVSCPFLLEFKFLKTLHISPFYDYDNNSDLYSYLIRFPALKTVYISIDRHSFMNETNFENGRTVLESHGIRMVIRQSQAEPGPKCPADGNFWLVSKSV